MSPCTEKSQYQLTMSAIGYGEKAFPVAQHCRDCTQTREYCWLHGVLYPSCSNEPNHQERMRLFP